jgi:hypothetical protein
LQPGDEIGVFDGSLCVGAITLSPHNLSSSAASIPAGASDKTGANGFTEGNSFTLRIWKAETNKEFVIEPEIISGTTIFRKHESTFASLKNLKIRGFENLKMEGKIGIRIFPNPTTGKVYIHSSVDFPAGTVVSVMNAIGQQVMNKTISANPEVIDFSGNVSGIYYIHLTGDPWSKTEKIILK